ncbi:MAG TPA: hypothetical protein VIN07_05950 [Flavipsychrobacter sp.]
MTEFVYQIRLNRAIKMGIDTAKEHNQGKRISKKRMLLTFGWSVIIMVVLTLLDTDKGPEQFPYVDGGTIVFFLLIVGLSQLFFVLTDHFLKPEMLSIVWPFLSNVIAITGILGVLFAVKMV